MDVLKIILLSAVTAIVVSFGLFGLKPEITVENPFSGVTQGDEYNATTTALSAVYGSQTGSVLLKTGQGALGSVIVTGAATGIINFYDATTTNINLRASSKATSTIHVASIPASLAAGTYVFDAVFTDGLYLELVSGNMPTTTITWR